ncbi:simple sugar transport system substrate-binding protein/LacI family transcriptional regulator [Alicyclobacillus sacchari]|uniref:Simple sugar transport system substrate-binding protein/LacI family transcriptional regulator n=1 Tax=Alicyclobacillus sacchari TaxID=392010 RepID=A0A4R8LRQ5_9BACL|nr:LacI family DNA-binding transcriptional regulator [Alicyclobacillus sacchari]TDY50194.1 simple sugar transport system substrate-binding protein/LacI family transcriptional regulator [Alicyclobacillus sacchari]GMA57420.1 transcriptional regulator [Alicyclobacillus sacchari]
MSERKRITKKAIAEQLGLSISTVDRALNGRGGVKPETYRRIMEAVEQLQYSVNTSARLLSKGRDVTIGVVLPEYPADFWVQIARGVEDAILELRDFGLHVEWICVSDTDESSQKTIADWIASGKLDGLALPGGNLDYVNVIDSAIDKGIPVCTFNIDAPSSKRLFYVGCDYANAGRLAAELMAKLLRGHGKVALVTDSMTSFQSQQKIIGFREELSYYPGVKLVGPLKMESEEPELSIRHMEHDLSAVDGIYVSNAEVHSFAISPFANDKLLIGHDMSPHVLQDLRSGSITAVICQDPWRQGYLPVKKLFKYITLGEDIAKTAYITRLEIVMRGNASFYI